MTSLLLLANVPGHESSPARLRKHRRQSSSFISPDIRFQCSSSPNTKLLFVHLWTPSASSPSSPGVTNLDVLSTGVYMSGLPSACIHWNMTSERDNTPRRAMTSTERWTSRRYLTLPMAESTSVSLAFDLDTRGCGVQQVRVARGQAYRYYFRSSHQHFGEPLTIKTTMMNTTTTRNLDEDLSSRSIVDGLVSADGFASSKPRKIIRNVLHSVRCYFYDNGRVETVVDARSDDPSAKRKKKRRFVPKLPIRRSERLVRKVWNNNDNSKNDDDLFLMSPEAPIIEAAEIWDHLKTKFRVALPVVDPKTDLTVRENISLVDHFQDLTRTYMKVIEPKKAHSFLRGLLHAVDDTVRDIIDRRTRAPDAGSWGSESTTQRSPKFYEKRLAIIVGVILAALLLATLLMIFLVSSDLRCRRRGAGGSGDAASASFCYRLCPKCFLSSVSPAERPLPAIPLPHAEGGRIELPPSILNASDRILVENV